MRKISYKFFILFFMVAVTGCYNYEEQFDGPYSDANGDNGPNIPREVVYVSGGDVYFATAFIEDAIRIDNSGNVRTASINSSHTTILYKRINDVIQIYDVEEERVTGEISGSEDASWFDFHANNETIFYLIGDDLHTQGPEVLDNQPIDLTDFFPIDISIIAAVITQNNDIIFTGTRVGFDTHYLVRTDGSNPFISNTYQFGLQTPYKDIRLSTSGTLALATTIVNPQLIRFDPRTALNFNRFTDSVLGAPANGNGLFAVLNNATTINRPPNIEVPITTGTITSIDH